MLLHHHGLASLYRRLIQNFSIITMPMTEVIKGTSFKWTPEAQLAFEEVKLKLTEAPMLALPISLKSLRLSVMHLEAA